MECCVGLDVHSKASVFAIQDGRGQVMAQGELPTTPEGFRRWDNAPAPAGRHARSLEAGTVAFFVARGEQISALLSRRSATPRFLLRVRAAEQLRRRRWCEHLPAPSGGQRDYRIETRGSPTERATEMVAGGGGGVVYLRRRPRALRCSPRGSRHCSSPTWRGPRRCSGRSATPSSRSSSGSARSSRVPRRPAGAVDIPPAATAASSPSGRQGTPWRPPSRPSARWRASPGRAVPPSGSAWRFTRARSPRWATSCTAWRSTRRPGSWPSPLAGRVVVSDTAVGLIAQPVPDIALRDLGEHRLRDIVRPVRLTRPSPRESRRHSRRCKTARSGASNLPAPTTSFVGRERELRELVDLLASRRLVTLTGAGGSGKTRLAVEVARGLAERHRDGICLVELAGLGTDALVPEAVLGALGMREPTAGRSATEFLCRSLADRDTAPRARQLRARRRRGGCPRKRAALGVRAAIRAGDQPGAAAPPRGGGAAGSAPRPARSGGPGVARTARRV